MSYRTKKVLFLCIAIFMVLYVAVFAAACDKTPKNVEAALVSFDGAAINGKSVSLEVAYNSGSLNLGDLVAVSEGATWQICSDAAGMMPYATKNISQLQNGDNTYYIRVTSEDGNNSDLYTLTVFKNYFVNITYMNGQSVYGEVQALTNSVLGAGPVITKAGFAFGGWGCEGHVVTAAKDFSATWVANTYTATLSPDGGELEDTSEEITFDSTYQLPVPTLEGYGFAGWYQENTQLTDAQGYGYSRWYIAGGVTLTARWIPNQYNVIASKNISAAGTVSGAGSKAYLSSVTLTAVTNAGYTWLGWYDGDTRLTLEEEYTFDMPMAAVAYTAKWASYGVTLIKSISAAGNISGNAIRITAGEEHLVEATTTTGYSWLGWYEGENLVSEESAYTFTMPASNVTLTATWGDYILSYAANISAAGWVGGDVSARYTAGTSHSVSASTYGSYTWLGWYEGENHVSDEQFYTFNMPYRSYHLVATWGDYTVTQNKNLNAAGILSGNSGQTFADTSCSATASTHAGYTWLGWYEGETLLTEENIYEYEMPYRNIVLTAHWEANDYQIQLDENGGDALDPDTFDLSFGEDFTLPVPVLQYYVFDGWYYVDGQTNTQVTDGEGGCFAGWNIADDITLTAFWSADETDGYIITADDLKNISMTGNYTLLNDIDLDGAEWTPLGSYYAPYTGVFDGGNHTISDFKITVNTVYSGLFGCLTGTVSDLNIEDVVIMQNLPSSIYVGCLAGYFNGTVLNCSADGEITVSANTSGVYVYINAGGLVGTCEAEGVIMDSEADVDITVAVYEAITSYIRAGGLAGQNQGELIDCAASGDIQTELYQLLRNYTGGLVGENAGTIDRCHAEGNVSAYAPVSLSTPVEIYAGGISGDHSGVIKDSYYHLGEVFAEGSNVTIYAGSITGSSKNTSIVLRCATNTDITAKMTNKNTGGSSFVYVGGLIGYSAGTLANSYYMAGTIQGEINSAFGYLYAGGVCGYMNGGSISRCYSTGYVVGTSGLLSTKDLRVGGFAGYNLSGTISNCYATGNVNVESVTTGDFTDAYAYAGGFLGICNGNVKCSYATGTVSAVATSVMDSRSTAYAGGFAGYYLSGAIPSCFAAGNVASQANTSGRSYAGGLFGHETSSGNGGYRCTAQSLIGGVICTSGTAATLTDLKSEAYLMGTVGFGKYTDEADRALNPDNVWTFADGQFPALYWQA